MALALCLLVAADALALVRDASGRPTQITVALDDNYPPYIFRNDSGEVQGILVDEWRAWEKATGVRVVLAAMDWESAQKFMLAGKADVIDTLFKTEERSKVYTFSKPYAAIEQPIFAHASLGGIHDYQTLRGFTVGVKAGDAVVGELGRHGITALREYASYKDIIEAARSGEIRVFSVDMPPALYYMYKHNMEPDFRQCFVLYTGQFHRAVRKGDEDILRLVEDGFAAIPDSTHKVIDHRWLGAPIASGQTLRIVLLALAGIGALALVLACFALVLRRRVHSKTLEIKAMLEDLQSSEGRFRTIFNSVSDLIFIHSWPDGRIVDVNQRACEAFGYTREDLLGFPVESLSAGFAPYDQAHAMQLMAKAHEGAPQVAEWLARARDGRLFWVEASIRRALLQDREHILVSCRDIGERKEAEELLSRERLFTDAVIDSVPGLLYLYDDQGRLLRWNKMHEELTGYSGLELSQMHLLDWYKGDAENSEKIRLAIERVMATGSASEEAELQTKSGEKIPFYLTAVRLELAGRVYFTGIGIDIRERRASEQRLADKEALLQAMLRNLPFDFWARDLSQRIILQSTESVRLWGDLGTGGQGEDRIDPGYRKHWQDVNRRALAGEVVAEDVEYLIPGGERRLYHSLVAPILHGERVLGLMGINIDTTERARAETALIESRRVLASIVDTVPQSIFWKDRRSVYLGCNQAFARDAGLPSPEAIIGKTDFDLPWVREEAEAYRADDGEVMASRLGKLNYLEPLMQGDGKRLWIETSKLPLLDDSGQAVGVVGIYEDVTERKLAAEALEHSKLEADAANLAKSEFLANMSHEIRTPLNGVLGMIELLKTTGLAGDQRDFVAKADEAARRLLSLLNDILDFSKIEAGRMVLNRNAFGLDEVFRTVSNVLGVPAAKKELSLALSIDPSVPPVLVGDDARIRQVLFNLVGNAVKFTRQGGVRVEAWRIPKQGAADLARLCLRVSDTGEGIADDKVRHVFERFTQSDYSHARQHEGAGLGLAIVKRIVDLMDGSITVDSELGRGTDIYLTLDLGIGPTGAVLRPQPEAARPELPPLRILLAEDEPIGQMALKVQLSRLGHTVTAVNNGREALAALDNADFDCVLMDIQMPELDGMEATRIIRAATGPKSRLPIIALTAYVMEGDREKFLAAGMDGHVGKPVQTELLLQELAEVLARLGAKKP